MTWTKNCLEQGCFTELHSAKDSTGRESHKTPNSITRALWLSQSVRCLCWRCLNKIILLNINNSKYKKSCCVNIKYAFYNSTIIFNAYGNLAVTKWKHFWVTFIYWRPSKYCKKFWMSKRCKDRYLAYMSFS